MKTSTILFENQLKLFFYLALIGALIVLAGYFVSDALGYGRLGLEISLIIAFITTFISYFYSDSIVINSSKAYPVDENKYANYVELVKDMCSKNNIKMPRLYMINSNALNAFATGRNKNKAVVAVTSGLLKTLSPNEIRGVVAHELSHIKHGDILVMSVIGVLAGAVSILSSSFRYGSFSRNSRNNNSGITLIIALIAAFFAPLGAMLIKAAVSRTREYMADAEGGRICGNPNYLADALYRIKNDGAPLETANEATAHLYIANPFKTAALSRLMSTHPDIDDRIRKLRNADILN